MLADAGPLAGNPASLFNILSNADFPYPTVTLSSGKSVKLDQAAYGELRALPNRANREKVMSAFFGSLGSFGRTFGTSMSGEVLKLQFYSKARKYPSSEALAFRALLNPGEEVLIIEPAFVSYPALVKLAGGKPVQVGTSAENGFKVTPEQIEAAITDRTKAILICSPNNPTGTFLNKADLEKIAHVAMKHNLVVITDEIYAELTYDEEYTSMASIPGMYERTITINGFSKAFAMTGWRLGYVAAPVPIVQAMLKIHQYTTMCAPHMLQHGAIEALRNGKEQVSEMKRSYRRRRNFIVTSLNDIGLDCHTPGGAFYVFPSIKNTGLTSEEFAEELLKKERVAVVPGNAFGKSGEGYIRCSYATSMEQLQEAIVRMERFLQSLNINKEQLALEK